MLHMPDRRYMLLHMLTGSMAQGIKQQASHPMVIQANLSIVWELMQQKEDIDLGGITSLCTYLPSVHGCL
jgi:hypothetical protein